MLINDRAGIGRIDVRSLELPEFVREPSATYTYSGKVLIDYKQDTDPNAKDYFNIAIADDDGLSFKNIFSGTIPQHPKANGIRFMPFQDNKRVLLGDYVMECSPNIDNCEKMELIPVIYPWDIDKDEHTYRHWSEIIISPDNRHICWTALFNGFGAANIMGVLHREESRYIILEPQIISSMESFTKDGANEDYILPMERRGGEVKQFVRGGTAISLAGAKKSILSDSIMQDLLSEEILQITNTPGYDETTIFSPDERLGIVMSTRGSKPTNCAIFGLVPRPYGLFTTEGLIMPVYMYAVAGVRSFREGNIGPVLIDINKSMNEEGYQGVQLNDPGESWVYCSPMSWHPDGKKVMWPEILRGSDRSKTGRQTRIRIARLLDYEPQKPVLVEKTPDNIPYGVRDSRQLWPQSDITVEGKISGSYSGFIEYKKQGKNGTTYIVSSTKSTYVNYSDDGKIFYNGYEKLDKTIQGESIYESDIDMTGEKQGEMRLRVTFLNSEDEMPTRLLFEDAGDGRPKSFGYARYNGIQLNVADMPE